jgi:predicted DCC family thiol-disulfide oxidoreductase YuxK
MKSESVILFDGICNLCNSSVQFVIRHDKEAKFKFASLQSDAGKSYLKAYRLSDTNLTSVVLIKNGKAYTKSTAALLVAKEISGMAKLLYGFIIIPAFLRDIVYLTISRNRYRWFGEKDHCMVPTPDVQSRFLK